MARLVGVEEARGTLGQLVDEVARGGEPIALTKHGRPRAVLLGADAYDRLAAAERAHAREELARRLTAAQAQMAEAGLDPSVLEEALRAARALA